MNEIFSHYIYGIDFYNEADEIIKEIDFGQSEEAREIFWHLLEDETKKDLWPAGAVRVADWKRAVMHQPIRGIDYGPGSVKRRFGGGHVPRSTYQFGNG